MHSAALDLSELGFGGWTVTPLQGDASSRRFYRLAHPSGRTAIAMQTPADQIASQDAFISIATHLTHHGLCAPKLLAGPDTKGMLVVEDLGTDDIAHVAQQNPQTEAALYQASVDVLLKLAQLPLPPNLATLTAQSSAQMLDPFFEYFAPTLDHTTRDKIRATQEHLLSDHFDTQRILSLRDYHAQNLIWRADKHGTDRIGLIDFQDAFLAPAEYDLVSLLRDARRDVSDEVFAQTLTHYCDQSGADMDRTKTRCAVLCVQRNLRILGIFARLAKQGKPSYLGLVPRVIKLLQIDLSHPALAPMAAQLADTLTTGKP